MNCLIGAKRLLTPNGWAENQVLDIRDGRISRIASGRTADYTADIVAPGLIDPHLHGGSGFDVMSATVEGMEAWLSDLAKSGVGAVLASPYTSPTEQMRDSLAVIRTVMERQKEGAPGARLLGAHLEGPFISMERPGSMETQYIQPPTEKACRELIEGYEPIIREMTLAPEVPGCGDLVDLLLREGIRVQAGHCDATFGEGEAAFRRGVGSICHFFNGARPIRHRDPGFLTAALVTPDIYCEMITDFVHLDPGAVRLLWKCKGPDRLILISDAVSTTNLPDGRYFDNGIWVVVKNGQSRTEESGGLTGGGTYLPGAVRNLVSIGIPADQALNAGAANAARWLQVDSGIRLGAEANLTGWTEDLTPLFTLAGGHVHQKEASN